MPIPHSVLRIACRRHDWSNALFDGRIEEPGMAFLPEAHLGIESLLSKSPEVDIMECGFVNYYEARSAGRPIKALPVFLRAAFRHSYIFVNPSAGIERPEDLEGKRVGTRYGMTANVWARALLQHEYGVRLERVLWLNQDSRAGDTYHLPAGTKLESIPEDVNLQDWLVEGRIDALVHADVVAPRLLARGNVKRLFSNAAAEERKYYRSSQIVPVMNVLAFRDPAVAENVPKAVFDVFCRAKELGLAAMEDVRGSGLLWYDEALASQTDLLGRDPAPYAIDPMRRTLEALIGYGLEQGVFSKRLLLDELFWSP